MATVKGTAMPTKDGFYVGDCILRHEELEKYDPSLDIEDHEVEVAGRIEEKYEDLSGEIKQGREGKVKYIVDVESVTII